MRNDFKEGAFLAHSAKGTSWKNVKYLKKVPLGNNRYYYIYTQAQLNAWNKRHSGEASNVLSNKERDTRKTEALKSAPNSLNSIIKNGMVAKGQTIAEKTANLQKNIADGEAKIQKALATEETKSSSKKGSGSSGSSGKSKSSKGGKSSGSGSSKASKEKSGSSKEKSSSAKKATKKTTAKTAKSQLTKDVDNTPITMDTLTKVYGKKKEDVSTHKMSAMDFKKEMLSKYKDGSFGYLMAGNKAYKWSIQGGNIILRDYNTDKEVSFDKYLKNSKQFEEFQTNNIKKK